jgi:hypothetical protein
MCSLRLACFLACGCSCRRRRRRRRRRLSFVVVVAVVFVARFTSSRHSLIGDQCVPSLDYAFGATWGPRCAAAPKTPAHFCLIFRVVAPRSTERRPPLSARRRGRFPCGRAPARRRTRRPPAWACSSLLGLLWRAARARQPARARCCADAACACSLLPALARCCLRLLVAACACSLLRGLLCAARSRRACRWRCLWSSLFDGFVRWRARTS